MGDHDAAVDFALEALAVDPLHADGQVRWSTQRALKP